MVLSRKANLGNPFQSVALFTNSTNRGILTYAIINTATWLLRTLSRGSIEPPDYELKEYWSCEYYSESSSTPQRKRRLTVSFTQSGAKALVPNPGSFEH